MRDAAGRASVHRMSEDGSGPNQRQEDVRRRLELEAAVARHESVRAQVLVDEFVVAARELGLVPERLQGILHNGTRVKSDQVGFYLNSRKTLAITPEGGFLQLLTTGSALSRFTGVKLTPSPPPIEVGKGGRDGETGPLKEFLAKTLETYGANRPR